MFYQLFKILFNFCKQKSHAVITLLGRFLNVATLRSGVIGCFFNTESSFFVNLLRTYSVFMLWSLSPVNLTVTLFRIKNNHLPTTPNTGTTRTQLRISCLTDNSFHLRIRIQKYDPKTLQSRRKNTEPPVHWEHPHVTTQHEPNEKSMRAPTSPKSRASSPSSLNIQKNSSSIVRTWACLRSTQKSWAPLSRASAAATAAAAGIGSEIINTNCSAALHTHARARGGEKKALSRQT